MRPEEREVKMTTEEGGLSEGFAYEVDTPESWAEAVDTYGEAGAFGIFLSGLKVKQDNVARNAFKANKTREEVEATVSAWRPGGQRTSKKTIATQLLLDHAATIATDPKLKSVITKAFASNDYDTIIEELEKM